MILHLEADVYPAESLASLRWLGPVVAAQPGTRDELVELMSENQPLALFVTLGMRIDAPVMDASANLRWIVSPTTGLDHIDIDAAHRRGIAVLTLLDAREHIQDVSATAELTWGLLLAVARRIPEAAGSVQQGTWNRTNFFGSQLRGKTLGIVGLGRLGRMVAAYGRAFGMYVLAHEVAPEPAVVAELGVQLTGDKELLERSDVISIHLPLTRATNEWLNAERISRLKPGALVLNTARGQLVDEEALAEAVRSGAVGGVGVDVLHHDSTWGTQVGPNALLTCALNGFNVVVTPHIGGYADFAVHATRRLIVEVFVERFTSA